MSTGITYNYLSERTGVPTSENVLMEIPNIKKIFDKAKNSLSKSPQIVTKFQNLISNLSKSVPKDLSVIEKTLKKEGINVNELKSDIKREAISVKSSVKNFDKKSTPKKIKESLNNIWSKWKPILGDVSKLAICGAAIYLLIIYLIIVGPYLLAYYASAFGGVGGVVGGFSTAALAHGPYVLAISSVALLASVYLGSHILAILSKYKFLRYSLAIIATAAAMISLGGIFAPTLAKFFGGSMAMAASAYFIPAIAATIIYFYMLSYLDNVNKFNIKGYSAIFSSIFALLMPFKEFLIGVSKEDLNKTK